MTVSWTRSGHSRRNSPSSVRLPLLMSTPRMTWIRPGRSWANTERTARRSDGRSVVGMTTAAAQIDSLEVIAAITCTV
ncbi:hypothetical protein D3C83_182280 [compost metagenome]